MGTSLLTPATAQAEGASQAGAESLNGDGFYRFKIGDFQATVISDGSGQLPIRPILAMNVSEAELAPVLKANFMQPVIQITNNILVVDTGRERILVDSGFGEKLGPSFGSFPGLEANLRRAGITPESIDLVVISHAHLDHIGGLVAKSGALAFPESGIDTAPESAMHCAVALIKSRRGMHRAEAHTPQGANAPRESACPNAERILRRMHCAEAFGGPSRSANCKEAGASTSASQAGVSAGRSRKMYQQRS